MLKGHVTGTKRERKGHGSEWWKALEEEQIQKVEHEWQAQHPQQAEEE